MTKLSMRHLSAVRELARTRSFTEAAARLHTSQSNISLAVQEAEGVLGTRLFERTTKRFELTPAGADFVPVVERILDDLQAGIDNVTASAQLQKGTLAVGGTPLLMATLLCNLLSRYHAAHPNIHLHLEDASIAELIRLLRSRSIEIALGTFVEPDADLTITPLYQDPLVALAHTSLRLPNSCSWSRILESPQVSIVRSSSTGTIIDETVRTVTGKSYRPLAEAHYWSSVVSLAEALRAVCIVPAYAANLARGHALKRISLVDPPVVRSIAVAHLKKREISPAGNAFLALLKGTDLLPPKSDEWRPKQQRRKTR